MKLNEVYQKQGGSKLIKQYIKNRTLFTATSQFFLLGKSRTALEILRLSAQLKTKQKLEKKYKNKLREFESSYDNNLQHKSSNKVWVCWVQGIESAPKIVKKCYQSLLDNLLDKEIVLITSDNMLEYADFPRYIIDKWRNGEITDTHMTDLLRLELLTKYGGMWIDATVLCTRKENEIPEYYFNSDLFLYQCLKPGRDGHSTYISSWLISAKSNNKILMATKFLCYEYWKKHNNQVDYFLLHDFLSIVMEFYKEEWNKIVPVDNATPHILLLRLFDEYDEKIWSYTKEQTPFHKLTYKFSDKDEEKEGTYYKAIIE